ncbi:hypothetical protein EBU95_21245, partial [bacterium]|nr:hypothetical protein [bacterium]
KKEIVAGQARSLFLEAVSDMSQVDAERLASLAESVEFNSAEDFANNPERIMRGLYNYLELPYYEGHDFNNVSQITKEDDEVYGLSPTLHTIKPNIQPLKDDSQQILGADICGWIDSNPGFDWYNQAFGYGKYKYKGTIIQ